MSPNKITLKQKIKLFFKRNLYPIIVSASALTLAIALMVTALYRNKLIKEEEVNQVQEEVKVEENVDKAEASSPTAVVFSYPVKDFSLGSTFSDTTLSYNQTLDEWSTHLGIDFIVSDGADVYPCLNGVVESVDYSSLDGTSIVIDHGDGLKTVYKSMSSDVMVEIGQEVTTDDVIGKASSSATGEASLGSHIHLEVLKDGELVNPMTYLGEK